MSNSSIIHLYNKGNKMEINISNKTLIRTLIIVFGFLALILLLTKVSEQLVWLAISIFLALALEPAVAKISRWMPGKNRILAIAVVFTLFIGVLSFLVISLLPPIISQTTQAVTDTIYYAQVNLHNNPYIYDTAKDYLQIDKILSNEQQIISGAAFTGNFVFNSIMSIFTSIIATLTIIIFTFLLVYESPVMVKAFWRYQPENKIEKRKKLLKEMYGSVTGFVGGTLVRCGIAGVVTSIALFLIGIPYALPLGLLIAVFGIIPMIGGLIGAAIIIIVSFLYGGVGAGIIVLGFFIIYSTIENYILQPIIFKKAVKISPFVTCVAAIFGVAAGGFIGALIAIPIAASAQILARDYLENKGKI